MMKLKRFRVTNFRSVEDSGWIETDDVTALIGTNESGKTNVLLPLWKLSPAKEGEIVPLADYPRKLYNEFRTQKPQPDFIHAVFDVGDNLAQTLSAMTGLPPDMVRSVEVSRDFDGLYAVDFPEVDLPQAIEKKQILSILDAADHDLKSITTLKSEQSLKNSLVASLQDARESLPSETNIGEQGLRDVLKMLEKVKIEKYPKTGQVVPRYQQACDEIRTMQEDISRVHPDEMDAVTDLILKNLPKFVYYATYGNLDSEIYLPHVIANLTRNDLGTKEQAKARTLKVLFEFVKLKPQEILELGHDFKDQSHQPTDQEIAAITKNKKERSILLHSASANLTKRFREWWKQGEYRFRFEADGDHFRIWVSDDRRPEEIELEGRSSGLQWFLSFYLVFLAERTDAHEGAILLLDEPGLSLHPLAQRDLSEFFDGLAKDNQLIYTCHSPFLIDADRLDRARKVYVGADGTSRVTADLTAVDGDIGQRGAAYAVHAALGLSVAESLLLGCAPVIVEGPSDQHYLIAIKTLLVAAGRLRPSRELVFPPAGGSKGVRVVASILGGRDEELPVALTDSDAQGRAMAKALRSELYANDPHLVLEIGNYTGMVDSEIEDIIPPTIIADALDRWQRTADLPPFADAMEAGKPIVPQIEAWAEKYGVNLPVPGWKVELAKRVKKQLLGVGPSAVPEDVLNRWVKLFKDFQNVQSEVELPDK
jgi:predicted ATP-dependent endonuclease of OLD family